MLFLIPLLFSSGMMLANNSGAGRAVVTPAMVDQTFEQVAIAQAEGVPYGTPVKIVGYYSHESEEIDGDLQIWLIDHHGNYVVAEAPRRYRDMKYEVRALKLRRGELVQVEGTMTQQFDKRTERYPRGWMEVNPIAVIARYTEPKPADLQ